MRRRDREMGEAFALGVIDRANYGVLSLIDTAGKPYGLPLSIVREGQRLYFHSAKAGKKIDDLTNTSSVCVTFVGETRIPELYSEEELQHLLADEKKGAALTSRVFTTEYESAIVYGTVQPITDPQEAAHALRLICLKYTPSKMDYFDLAIRSGLPRTSVYAIHIDTITGKRKKFDSAGEEMKWGRME